MIYLNDNLIKIVLILFTVSNAKSDDISNHKNINLLPKECGLAEFNIRIIAGNKAELFEFPWMALITYQHGNATRFNCEGTIISDRYILTAAHCLQSKFPIVGVRVGELNLETDLDCNEDIGSKICAPPAKDIGVEEVIPYPTYNSTTLTDDIALIRVKKMSLKDNVRPICLPLDASRTPNFVSNKAIVTGWSRLEGKRSHELLRTGVKIVSFDECTDKYLEKVKITAKQICAGTEPSREVCSIGGDPLQTPELIDGDLRTVQYGVVSFGPKNCKSENTPEVFTKVADYMQWILDTLKP